MTIAHLLTHRSGLIDDNDRAVNGRGADARGERAIWQLFGEA